MSEQFDQQQRESSSENLGQRESLVTELVSRFNPDTIMSAYMGSWSRCLFAALQRIRGFDPRLRKWEDVEEIFNDWFERAGMDDRVEWDEAIDKAQQIFPTIRHGSETSKEDLMASLTEVSTNPSQIAKDYSARHFGKRSTLMPRMIQVVLELHRRHKGLSWFISTRDMACVLGMTGKSHDLAARKLKELRNFGLIEEVDSGNKAARRCPRYALREEALEGNASSIVMIHPPAASSKKPAARKLASKKPAKVIPDLSRFKGTDHFIAIQESPYIREVLERVYPGWGQRADQYELGDLVNRIIDGDLS